MIAGLMMKLVDNDHFSIYVNKDTLGWLYVGLDIIARKKHLRSLNLHFFITNRKDWEWGYEESWYDGPICEYKLGPFARLFWM